MLRGSLSIAARSFETRRTIASSQEISFQPGSTPTPFSGLVRIIGTLTRLGE